MTKKKIFFTAEQAENILKGKNNWVIEHLICSRVIDTWNIKDGIGRCYYISNNMKPRRKDFKDLDYPSGKIFQAYDIIGRSNMDMYNKLLGSSTI